MNIQAVSLAVDRLRTSVQQCRTSVAAGTASQLVNVSGPTRKHLANAALKETLGGFMQPFTPMRPGTKAFWTAEHTPAHVITKFSYPISLRAPQGWPTAAVKGEEAGGGEEEGDREAGADGGPLSFINKAAENVIAHNFTSDAEPAAWKETSVSSGWGADIHSKSRQGFHAITPSPEPPSSKKHPAPATAAEPRKKPSPMDSRREPSPMDSVLTYLTRATEGVIAHNFTGDATEPEAWKGQGDKMSTGWKGEIHIRQRNGFHAI